MDVERHECLGDDMRWTNLRRTATAAGLALGLTMALSACGGDADSVTSATTTSNVVTSTETVTSTGNQTSGPAQAGPIGDWTGSWASAGEELPASLNITVAQPLTATIDIPGRCGASWTEQSRAGNQILVRATVTYGNCADNTWSVRVDGDELSATDTEDADTTLSFTRQ